MPSERTCCCNKCTKNMLRKTIKMSNQGSEPSIRYSAWSKLDPDALEHASKFLAPQNVDLLG
jgi:hypothetical protein